MSETLRIIEASSPAELEAVRELLVEYATSLGWDPSTEWMAEELRRLPGPYSPPRGSLLLAYVDGTPAGVVALQPVPEAVRLPVEGVEWFGEIKRLYVRPQHRRLGIARALIDRVEDEARERGYSAAVLTTSAEMFPLAQGLYESLGYGPTEPYRDDMPWPTVRWMRKDLQRG